MTGNPVKFGLGFTSMFFDIIFGLQHYVMFAPQASADKPFVSEDSVGIGDGQSTREECASVPRPGDDIVANK